MTTDVVLNDAHWVLPHFRQRMTVKQWRDVLLAESDTIMFRGAVVQLKANRLGAGVVEVYKDLTEE